MRPRVTLITLGVGDLSRAVAFYREGLRWKSKGIVGAEDAEGGVAFFQLENGLKLALWERKSIAADAGLPVGAGSATDFTLAHNVDSEDEVERVMKQAAGAGARIVKTAATTFYGGYAGYFQDPDGHLWEVAYNPGFDSLG
jgi:uncharacterized glyoxalase superfamily protein PhnB